MATSKQNWYVGQLVDIDNGERNRETFQRGRITAFGKYDTCTVCVISREDQFEIPYEINTPLRSLVDPMAE